MMPHNGTQDDEEIDEIGSSSTMPNKIKTIYEFENSIALIGMANRTTLIMYYKVGHKGLQWY